MTTSLQQAHTTTFKLDFEIVLTIKVVMVEIVIKKTKSLTIIHLPVE